MIGAALALLSRYLFKGELRAFCRATDCAEEPTLHEPARRRLSPSRLVGCESNPTDDVKQLVGRNFFNFSDLKFGGHATRIAPPKDEIMESTLVRRDQFNITPQGIVHKPTAAAFMPYPGDPYSGITRTGQLGNKHPNGIGFSAEDVQRMMRELWVEYVTSNPTLFKPGCAEPGPAEFELVQSPG